jgi:hypothetical protein
MVSEDGPSANRVSGIHETFSYDDRTFQGLPSHIIFLTFVGHHCSQMAVYDIVARMQHPSRIVQYPQTDSSRAPERQ